MLSESIRTLGVLMFTVWRVSSIHSSVGARRLIRRSQQQSSGSSLFSPQKINKYKVPMKEAAEFVFIYVSGPQIITSGSSLTRQSSKRGHAGALASCLPLSPTSCSGQWDERNKLDTKCLLEMKNKVNSTLLPSMLYIPNIQHRLNYSCLRPTMQQLQHRLKPKVITEFYNLALK